MSLLLDALKKSASARQQQGDVGSSSGGKIELSLEEHESKPQASVDIPPKKPSPNNSVNSPRSTGENLFAAKKAPARKKFNYNLGIVPTASIIGLVLATAGSIYVWYEIQPPKQGQYRSPAPAIAANSAPAPRPAPLILALSPEVMPATEAKAAIVRPAPAKVTTERQTRTSNIRRAPTVQSEDTIQVQRKLENNDTYTIVVSAYQAYQNGDLGTAWQRYRDVLIKDAKNRDALLGMAAIAQQQGQDEVAIQYYKQLLALDPRDPVAHAGMSSFSTVDAASRESRLKQNLAQTPQSAALHYALGNLYTEQSRWGDAQQAYFNALKIEPANAQFAFNLATSLDHLGQKKIAARYYRQALQLDSKGNSGFDRAQTEQRLKQLIAP